MEKDEEAQGNTLLYLMGDEVDNILRFFQLSDKDVILWETSLMHLLWSFVMWFTNEWNLTSKRKNWVSLLIRLLLRYMA